MASRGLLPPRSGDGTPRLRTTVCVFLTGSGLSLNANNRFTHGSTGGLLSNHQHICFIGYGVTISESAVFSSSLEKPERPQYSICQSALEPFISTLCTYLEEKKITHKHKHITGGRAPTSSCTPLLSPLPPCHTARWEGPFVLLVAAETGPSLLGSAQGSYTEYSETYLLP